MATHINAEGVDKVAHLARLQLTGAEKAAAVKELESILTYMDRLAEVDTTTVAPYAPEAIRTVDLRDDAAKPFAHRDLLLDPTRFKEDLLVTKGVFSDVTDTDGS